MKRRQLFEFEDQSWLPSPVRSGITDFLQHISHMGNPLASVIPLLAEAMRETGYTDVLDMCSGGGGGMLKVQAGLEEALAQPTRITLSDKYPNIAAFEMIQQSSDGKILFEREPIDAKQVPAHKQGFRTMFRAFHHFPEADARGILQNAAEQNVPIAIFEQTERSWQSARKASLFILLGVFTMAPAIRPRKASRFLLTYLLPVIPFCIWWDGMASIMRTYTLPELQRMADVVNAPHYTWQVGDTGRVTYLIGIPKQA